MRKALLLLFSTAVVFTILVGCGGGGPSTTTTTNNSGTGNAALKGNYVFSITAVSNEKALNPTQVFIAGVFAADGNGNITGGEEDTNQNAGGSIATKISLSGKYSIGSDGRGTVNLTGNGTTNTFAIAIETSGHGQIIFFNNATNGFGTFDLQSATSVAAASYAFGWNGFDNAKGPQSLVGVVPVSSSGGVASGVADINDDGVYTQIGMSGQLNTADSNGRGSATMTTPQLNGNGQPIPKNNGTYAYYVISGSRLIFIETDGNGVLLGEADAQTPNLTAANFSGNYVLSFSGDSSSGPIAVGAQLAASGAGGTITSGDITENIAGTYLAGQALTGTFGFATSVQGVTANGRGTVNLTLPDAAGATDQFVFYMVSSTQIYVMEIDTTTTGELMSGVILAQTSQPFSSASVTGNYGMQFSAVDTSGAEWDFSGQFDASGTSTISSGTLDINQGKDQLITNYTSSLALNGASYTVVNTLGRGTLTLPVSGATFTLTFYLASNNQMVLIETDGSGFTSVGAAQSQPAIP